MSRLILWLCVFVSVVEAAPSPAHDWNLEVGAWRGAAIRSEASGLMAKLAEAPGFSDDGAWVLSGTPGIAIDGVDPKSLPGEAISAEAWVAIDQGQKWGGLFGYAQDNGNYERGWLLGYNERSFVFWVSTGARMIEVKSETSFEPDKFYHVVGTYDGESVKLYVNGALEAERDATGEIAYPNEAFYAIGVYKDKDEHYPMHGRLRLARLYGEAMDAKGVLARARQCGVETPMDFAVQPALRFVSPTAARVTWQSAAPGVAAVSFGKTRRLGTVVKSEAVAGDHAVLLEGLEPDSTYFYKIGWATAGEKRFSPVFEFNTALNFTKPVLTGSAGEVALRALERTGVVKGYALVIGGGELALGLARASELSVVLVAEDPAAARRQLHAAGANGSRVTVVASTKLLSDAMVNLLVAGDDFDEAEVERLLIPGRGKAFLVDGDRVVSRPKQAGVGEWSHQYGDGGNSANSGDSVGGATATGDFEIAWFGRPGADFGIDRNPRMPAPLSAGGRLYHQGLNRLITLDAHNGAVLWSLEVPDLRRINLPRDCSNWCADADDLFVAIKDRAWVLDGETGERERTFSAGDLNWGYIAREGRMLIGSGVQEKAAYSNFWGGSQWFDGKGGEAGTEKVCSDSLFGYALDSAGQSPAWEYREGVVLNPTIAVSNGRVYFVETRNAELVEGKARRLKGDGLWKDQFLVALDARTGERVWEREVALQAGTASVYLQVAEGRVVVATSNTQFHLYSFDEETGEPGWARSLVWADDHHSGHIQHPVMMDGTLYLAPHGVDLKSGEVLTSKVGKREGCHTYVGAGGALLYRGVGRRVSLWDRENETVSNWPRLRPSCWLSTIPASGMLLMPEAGGGCSCGGWMETSLAFRPRLEGKTQTRIERGASAGGEEVQDVQK